MQDEGNSFDPLVASFGPVADALAKHFGADCEVVLHDLRVPESSLVHVAGDVTGRSVGAPITNIVLEAVRQHGRNVKDLVGYRTRSADGRLLRSSTIFIRSVAGDVVGCLCVNSDLTKYEIMRQLLNDSLTPQDHDEVGTPSGGAEHEYFAEDVDQLVSKIVDETVGSFAKPTAQMDKKEKLALVAQLENRGVFLVKGTVNQVARILGVTRYTVYNYLDEIRSRDTALASAVAQQGNASD